MSEITFTVRAYCKIILHAAKYPYSSINGVLLAKSGTAKGKNLEFVDAIPLFHNDINLTPMAEIALPQVDQVVSAQGLVIAGYYTAHENIKESSLEKANNRIADKVAENFSGACLVVVDNRNLGYQVENSQNTTFKLVPALKVAQFADGKYRPLENNKILLKPSHTLDVCTSLIEQGLDQSLIDFDNHLDDTSLDWANSGINKEIETIV